MPSPKSQDKGLDGLPGFAPLRGGHPSHEELGGQDEEFDESSLPESVDQSTTSPQPPTSSHEEGLEPRMGGSSSPASTDLPDIRPKPIELSADLERGLVNLAGGTFEILGTLANRAYRARTRTQSRLWLVTDDEAEDFGAAAGRIAGRHIPDELKEGDGADVLVMASVGLNYGQRNLAGIDDREADGLAPAQPQHVAAPPPPPAERREFAPAGTPVGTVGGAAGIETEAATPAPPSVISPGI
jgi:hypothetical protein